MTSRTSASNARLIAVSLLVASYVSDTCAGVDLGGIGIEPDNSPAAQRHALMLDGAHQSPPLALIRPSVTANSLAAAMSIPSGQFVSATLDAHPLAVAVLSELGEPIQPIQDATFAVLSTGLAVGAPPAPGTDLVDSGSDMNNTTLTVTLTPPQGVSVLTFNYNLLTTEYRAFAGSTHADRFIVTVTDADGQRQVLELSGRSESLVPISDDNGKDSGYDLYAPDENSIERVYGAGKSASSTSTWRRQMVPIDGSGPVTVEFKIEDTGDGLFDSAVLLDDLKLEPFFMGSVDPDNWCGQTFPSTDRMGGSGPVSVAADGVTKVILRFGYDEQNVYDTADLTIVSNSPHMGGLGEIGSDDRLRTITLPVDNERPISPGVEAWGAKVQYFVPEEFVRESSDMSRLWRPIQIRSRFYNLDGKGEPPFEFTSTVYLYRPPVVLMHGLWSRPATWQFSTLLLDTRVQATPGDYADTAGHAFEVNFLVPEETIQRACLEARGRDLYMSQVDYYGHSMGGNLGRIYDDQVPGRINKLVTLNTPHYGSPFANMLMDVRDSLGFYQRGLFLLFMSLIDKPVGGAIDDLAVGSDAILGQGPTTAPSHAFVGTGGSAWVGGDLVDSPDESGAMYNVISYFYDLNDFFDGDQHDLIVGAASQAGGVTASAISVFGTIDSIHTRAPRNPASNSRMLQLMNTAATGLSFETFPTPPAGLSSSPSFPPVIMSGGSDGGLEIVSPSPGATVPAGGTVQVTVEERKGFDAESVLVVTKTQAVKLTTPPFVATLNVPNDHIGPLIVAALGKNANGNMTSSQTVTVSAQTTAVVTGLDIAPRPAILIVPGSTQLQLQVLAQFNDGITRNVTHSSSGTDYLVSDENIVTASADGLLTAVGYGTTLVRARNNNRLAGTNVTVSPPPQRPDFIFYSDFDQIF